MGETETRSVRRRGQGSPTSRFVDRWVLFGVAGEAAIIAVAAVAAATDQFFSHNSEGADIILVDMMRFGLFWIIPAALFGWMFVCCRRIMMKPTAPYIRPGAIILVIPPLIVGFILPRLIDPMVDIRFCIFVFVVGSILVATTLMFYVLIARFWRLLD